jgi:hypothetical protein
MKSATETLLQSLGPQEQSHSNAVVGMDVGAKHGLPGIFQLDMLQVSTGEGVIEEAENIKKFFPHADLNQGESV